MLLIHNVIKIKCILTLNQHYTEHANRIKYAIQAISKWSQWLQIYFQLLSLSLSYQSYRFNRRSKFVVCSLFLLFRSVFLLHRTKLLHVVIAQILHRDTNKTISKTFSYISQNRATFSMFKKKNIDEACTQLV